MRWLGILGVLLVACSTAVTPTTEEVGKVTSPIIAGQPSGDDENMNVYMETVHDADVKLRCTGRIIAPGLVLTARHCLLKRRSDFVRCDENGNPIDITDTIDVETEAPEKMTVFIGSSHSSMRPVAVKEVFTTPGVTLCRSDVAYVTLAEAGLDTRTPIRRAPPKVGETVHVSGWGYVDDTQRTTLPENRSSKEAPISLVGPGLIPAGEFALRGGTVCLGDSGTNALVDGAAVGVYTRIEGDPNSCVNELGRNIFTNVMSEPELLTKAFAAIGEEPWFAGEERPWLAPTGSACTTNDDCRSGVCDQNACRPGCGPTKLGCPAGQECAADGQSCVTPAAPAPPSPAAAAPTPPNDSSCAATPSPHSRGGVLAALFVLAAIAWRRRRAT